MTRFSWILILVICLKETLLVCGEKRTDVVVVGTTLSPGFVRTNSKGNFSSKICCLEFPLA